MNQLTRIGGALTTYDQLGNMTSDGMRSYGYTSENRLASASGSTLAYDPLGRLSRLSASGTHLRYDGTDIVGESGTDDGPLRRRFVHGPGTDEPLVWYEATGDRRYLHADERGSIVAVSDGAGKLTGINTYDEYGKPGAGARNDRNSPLSKATFAA